MGEDACKGRLHGRPNRGLSPPCEGDIAMGPRHHVADDFVGRRRCHVSPSHERMVWREGLLTSLREKRGKPISGGDAPLFSGESMQINNYGPLKITVDYLVHLRSPVAVAPTRP